jgi:hypothetical protein
LLAFIVAGSQQPVAGICVLYLFGNKDCSIFKGKFDVQLPATGYWLLATGYDPNN